MIRIWAYLQSGVRDDSGATMVEYALMLAAVAVVVVVAAALLGQTSSGQFSDVDACFGDPAGC